MWNTEMGHKAEIAQIRWESRFFHDCTSKKRVAIGQPSIFLVEAEGLEIINAGK